MVLPPTAPDLALQSAKQEIPTALYNFLACITGSSEDVLFSWKRQKTSTNCTRYLVFVIKG